MQKRILSTIFLLVIVLTAMISPFGQAVIVNRNVAPQIIQANLVVDYRFTEGANSYVLNHATNAVYPNPLNYFGAYSEQLQQKPDGSTVLWINTSGVTLTDFYTGTTDPNGNNSATRVQMTASGSKNITFTTTLAATPYTLSVYVKSNTGVSQAIRMGNASSPSTDKTVTTSWTRVEETFTPSAGSVLVGILDDTALDALDISVYGFQLELGSPATAYVLPTGSMQLGKILSPATNAPTWASTGLDYGVSTFAHGISTTPITFAHISAYAVIKKPAASDSPGVFEPILTSDGSAYKIVMESRDTLNCGTSGNSTGPCFGFGFTGGAITNASGVKVDDGAWHVFAATYDGANIKLYWDGTQVSQKPIVIAAQTINRLFTGIFEGLSSATNYYPGSIGMLSLYTTDHSVTQVRQNTNAMFGNMALRSVVMRQATKFIGIEGDSIAAGAGLTQSQRWSWLMLQSISPVVNQWNDAVGGSTVATATSRAAVFNQSLNPNTPRNVLVVHLGANDITGAAGTGLTFVANLKAYCIAQRAAGWNKIVIVKVLPRGDIVNFNTQRNIANAAIDADPDFSNGVAGNIIVVMDSSMMADSAPSDPLLYQLDLVHPTAHGDELMVTGIQTAVESVLP